MHTLVHRWIGAAALVTAVSPAVFGVSTAAAAPQEKFPVWWSPSLELESLDQIDAILDAHYPQDDQVVVTKYLGDDNTIPPLREVIQNCRAHIRLIENGYEIFSFLSDALNLKRRYGDECFTLDALLRAKPATSSFVSEFKLNADALSILPPLFRPVWSCAYLRDSLLANREGVPWAEFRHRPYYAVKGVRPLSETELEIVGEDWSMHVELYGRGDFDGDGQEDLLIRTIDQYPSGFDRSHLYLLVRDGLTSPARILWEYGAYASVGSKCFRLDYEIAFPTEKPRRGEEE